MYQKLWVRSFLNAAHWKTRTLTRLSLSALVKYSRRKFSTKTKSTLLNWEKIKILKEQRSVILLVFVLFFWRVILRTVFRKSSDVCSVQFMYICVRRLDSVLSSLFQQTHRETRMWVCRWHFLKPHYRVVGFAVARKRYSPLWKKKFCSDCENCVVGIDFRPNQPIWSHLGCKILPSSVRHQTCRIKPVKKSRN